MNQSSMFIRLGWMCSLVLMVALLGAGGCAAKPRGHNYVFVTLKTGPNKEVLPEPRRKEIFDGHMANIRRLAADGSLAIAGPFSKPADPTWRGLFVLTTKDIGAAKALVQTDPGVQTGIFDAEYRSLLASPVILTTASLDAKRRAAPATVPPTPPVRPYVIIIAAHGDRCMTALARSGHAAQVVWCGRFTGTTEAVVVVDAPAPEQVREWLGVEAAHCSVDGWYSTDALVDLPDDARILPR